MSARTPGPWHLSRQGAMPGRFIRARQGSLLSDGPKDFNIAEVFTEDDEWQANAAFIVEACNAYDGLRSENARLREALGTLKREARTAYARGIAMNRFREPDSVNATHHRRIVAKLRRALKDACDALQDEWDASDDLERKEGFVHEHGIVMRRGRKALEETSA